MEQLFSFLAINFFLILIPLTYIAFFEKKKFTPIGLAKEFGFAKPNASDLVAAAKMLGLMIGVSLCVTFVFSVFTVSDTAQVERAVSGIYSYGIVTLAILFITRAFCEEVLFRAFLTPRLGALGSSILFGAAHFGYGSVSEIAGAFALGTILAYFYSKNPRILPVFIAHAAYNFFAAVVILQ